MRSSPAQNPDLGHDLASGIMPSVERGARRPPADVRDRHAVEDVPAPRRVARAGEDPASLHGHGAALEPTWLVPPVVTTQNTPLCADIASAALLW